jgi:hypothetical protein
MAIPAKFLFLFDQQVLVHTGMRIVAVSTNALLESAMHSTFADKIPDAFMTA